MKSQKNKILNLIPNWNGHLYLQNHKEDSVNTLYDEIQFKEKNLIQIEKNNIQKTNEIIEKEFEKNENNNLFQISITGDHSNSYPLIKSHSKKHGNDFNLVIFDAHPDVEIGTDLVSHEDYLRYLIDEDFVKPQNIYLIGIRTFSRTELEYLIEKGVNYYPISQVILQPKLIQETLKELKNIYLSVDIDVLDPDHAPGTYYTEYCGLYIEELLNYIEIIKPELTNCDVTEYYKQKDDESETTKVNTLKIINKLIE